MAAYMFDYETLAGSFPVAGPGVMFKSNNKSLAQCLGFYPVTQISFWRFGCFCLVQFVL
jgi:hypothetical protein